MICSQFFIFLKVESCKSINLVLLLIKLNSLVSSTIMRLNVLLLFFFFASCILVPQWMNLGCEDNHKYLFSDVVHSWFDAVAECQLYGGWLLSLGSLEEQNCLLRYGQSQGLDAWYWTDGRVLFLLTLNFPVTLVKTT